MKAKKLKHYNIPGHAHELTFSCYHGYNYLIDPKACELFLSELESSKKTFNLKIWAYVLMPTHVHILLWPMETAYDIARILNETKGRMAKEYRDFILKRRPETFESFTVYNKYKARSIFRFWQKSGGFDRNLWHAKAIRNAINYIEANPVKKKLAQYPENYKWSSAYARANNVGLIPDTFQMPVELLNPKVQRIGISQ